MLTKQYPEELFWLPLSLHVVHTAGAISARGEVRVVFDSSTGMEIVMGFTVPGLPWVSEVCAMLPLPSESLSSKTSFNASAFKDLDIEAAFHRVGSV